MAKKQIIIDAPSHPVIRYRKIDDRHVVVDLRGIRNPHSPFNGHINPTKGFQRKFVSPQHLESLCNEYFESCYGPVLNKHGYPVYDRQGKLVKTQVKPFTVSGLALYLKISTECLKKYKLGRVDTILDEMRAETDDSATFAQVIARARQRIESYAEERNYDAQGQRGGQYILDCCFGWKDSKTAAEVERHKREMDLKEKEFDLKQKLLDEDSEDNDFTINIVRAKRKDE